LAELPGKKAFFSLKTLYYHLFERLHIRYLLTRYAVIVTDDDVLTLLPALHIRETQRVVQVWHAEGVCKRSLFADPVWLSHFRRRDPTDFPRRYDHVIVSGPGCVPFLTEEFDVPPERFLALGCPRTDALVRARWEGRVGGGGYALWCPTHRTQAQEPYPPPPETALPLVTRLPGDKTPFLPQLLQAEELITDFSSAMHTAAVAGIPVRIHGRDARIPVFETAGTEDFLSACDGNAAERVRNFVQSLLK